MNDMVRDIWAKDMITNITTALMAIRDLSTYNDIPIDIRFTPFDIHVMVGFGTRNNKTASFYLQDMYDYFSTHDEIYNSIIQAISEIKEGGNYGLD